MRGQFTLSFNIDGVSFTETATVEGEVNQDVLVDQPAAQAGILTTRTDNDTGTITMSSGGHTITTGMRVDLYWTGGVRRGVTVGTVSGTAVPIDLGSGDNLPSTSTAIKVAIPTERTFAFDGDDVMAIACKGSCRSQFVIVDVANAELKYYYNHNSKVPYWYYGNGVTNPLAGTTVATVFVSHGETTEKQLGISVMLSQ